MSARAPSRDLTEEVRLAMAWNGGISLAVWMAGAAVELDAARRAHLGRQDEEGNERSLYNVLTTVFNRKLVVDIVAGASAGGLNGALLGAAIAHKRELRPSFLRDRWLEIGDFAKMLRPVNEKEPRSLMRGDYFHEQVQKVFRALTGEGDDPEMWRRLTQPSQQGLEAGQVLLDVQTTSILGAPRGFSDAWGQTLFAREYRAPVRFREPEDYTAGALALAARASASFPAAFEPTALTGKTARLAGFQGLKRWAFDGGLLENAPIHPAIDLIPTRRAELPVTRFVCYVNAAPAAADPGKPDPDDPVEPELRDVVANVVSLPRHARFVDQLTAIEDAVQRAPIVDDVARGLLVLPSGSLREVAESLLDAYRTPRTVQSLWEIMAVSLDLSVVAATVEAVSKRLGDRRLPWIPDTAKAPTEASEWRWGLRAAQRVIVLQLDVFNLTAEEGDGPVQKAQKAEELLEFRKPLNKALDRLEDARRRFAGSSSILAAVRALGTTAREDSSAFDEALEELDRLVVGFRCEAFDAVRRTTEKLYEAVVAGRVSAHFDAKSLFGQSAGGPFAPEHLTAFLERALCVEIVRRAFVPDRDLEAAQRLQFVQLTPLAPGRIFTPTPLSEPGPDSGRSKLTGLDLAHFAAFYRSSWRANDFLWGRLDAATRIVDLLVSGTRFRQIGGGRDDLEPLAAELVPDGDDPGNRERRQLVAEALEDAASGSAPGLGRDVVAAAASTAGPDDRDGLRESLRRALEADLADPDGGFFTRVVSARAAQYEVVRQELGPLAKATRDDAKLGAFTKPIRYDPERGVLGPARELVGDGERLLVLLGSGVGDETTSTLAVRTISHAALVSLSAVKTAGVPLGGAFGLLRAPFLSLAGITAAKVWNRGAALLWFVAASFYVTARSVTAADGPEELSALWSPATVAALVAALGALGLVLLPLWRAVQADAWPRRSTQGVWFAALLSTSGLVAFAVAAIAVGYGNALAATSGFALSAGLAGVVIGLPLGAAALIGYVRIPDVGGLATKLFTRPGLTSLATAVVAALVIREASGELREVVGVGELFTTLFDADRWEALAGLLDSPSELWDAVATHWRGGAVVAAYLSIPLVGLYGLQGFVGRLLDRPAAWLRRQWHRVRPSG